MDVSAAWEEQKKQNKKKDNSNSVAIWKMTGSQCVTFFSDVTLSQTASQLNGSKKTNFGAQTAT